MAAVAATPAEDIRRRMDRMYRPQKHIYDLTRRYYLIGRDRLIEELGARAGQTVLDVGCGTGRNLKLIGERYPGARLFGLDAAEPMLEIAATKLARAGVRATLARGVAEALDPVALFAHPGRFDHITVSYCLSMVDDPEAAIRSAVRQLAPGGTLHAARRRLRGHGGSTRLVTAGNGGMARALPRTASAGGGGDRARYRTSRGLVLRDRRHRRRVRPAPAPARLIAPVDTRHRGMLARAAAFVV
jgi:S-adenosylmethionine-diacylgycerolhomoserine-N-methlytransferase